MSEYGGLKFKTNGNVSPQGKPRVFFCCCASDFQKMFDPVSDQILETQNNAAIWYYDPKEGIPDGDAFLADLSQMQLFVIPVTADFLFTDNHARTVEFAYAKEHHIPLLPLMQEEGMANDFNSICGNLQFLDQFASEKDPTSLSYIDKLYKFLSSVLISNELAQKIRDAFDAYIFLSYRKKDRMYAQQIMKLIHENEFCRDVAIWYDEFLTPGENFNQSIEAAMKKSALFALVVTPNLLENPNYVMEIEYPKARESGKPILAVTGVETDDRELAKLYEDIDPAHSKEEVAKRLHEAFRNIALQANQKDPFHNLLIGLAYLSGIDVEVDHDRGIQLISSAAEAGLKEAFIKLIFIYENGDGVKTDYDQALLWRKKYVDLLKKEYDKDKTKESLLSLILELRVFADSQRNNGKIRESETSYNDLLTYCKQLESYDPDQAIFYQAVCSVNFGNLGMASGYYSSARENYQNAMNSYQHLYKKTGNPSALFNMTDCYERIANAYSREGSYKEAEQWFQKALRSYDEIEKKTVQFDCRSARAGVFQSIADIYMSEENFSAAFDYYMNAFNIVYQLVQEKPGVAMDRFLNDLYLSLGNSALKKGEYKKAEDLYLLASYNTQILAKRTNTAADMRVMCSSYDSLCGVYYYMRNIEKAKKYNEAAIHTASVLFNKTNLFEDLNKLGTAYGWAGDLRIEEGNRNEAGDYYRKAYDIFNALAQQTNAVMILENLLHCSYRLGTLQSVPAEQRKQHLTNCLGLSRHLFERTGIQWYRANCDRVQEELNKLNKRRFPFFR